ncbi:DUF5906 domain-containing protein, partial [Salipiger profundus]|uniref:DUF5906 domain-containing protein n=1 Tax=Salipiger profundus TaxID=1229727 RepID=UPI0008E70F7D
MDEIYTLYGQMPSGYLSVSTRSGGKFKVERFFLTSEWREMEAYIIELSKSQDTYFSFNVVTHRPLSGRGTSEYFGAAPGVFLDVDLKQAEAGIHSANDRLPSSLEEVFALLDRHNLPRPTQVVRSGNGFYFRYLFDVPYYFETEEDRAAFQKLSKGAHQRFAKVWADEGWTLDDMSDLPRVTRMGGTFNHKTTPAKPVELMEELQGSTFSHEWFKEFASKGIEECTSVTVSKSRSAKPGKPDQIPDGVTDLAKLGLVYAGCPWLRDVYGRRENLPYPEWMAIAGLMKHCEDGEDHFHEWSAADPRYDEVEAAKLFENIEGPMTCAHIAGIDAGNSCFGCPASANKHVGTPVAFGRAPNVHLAAVFGSHAFMNERERFKDVHTGREYSKQNFNDHFARYFKQPAATVLSSKLLLQTTTSAYLPGVPERFVNTLERGLLLNTWTPSQLTPEDGDIRVILVHLAYLIPAEVEREHFLDVLAHTAQKPGDKIKHCILLIGGQGIGKSWLFRILELIVGKQNIATADNDTLSSTFNARMADKQVLVCEEVGQSDRAEAYNRMKVWISEETVTVEEKHQPRYEAQTPRLMIGFSNRSLPIKIEGDDRRFMFIEAPKAPLDDAYYKRLFSEGLQQAAAFLDFLLRRDISNFSPHARPPMTALKVEVAAASRPAVEAEVEAMIQNEEAPFDRELFRLTDLSNALRGRLPYKANEKRAKVGDALRGGISWRCSDAVNSLSRKGYAT